MAPFWPVYVRRSDGKLETVGKGKRKEPNQPTEDQLDQKPDKDGISDFYREVLPDEAKHLDWRRKLGGMLARELEGPEKLGTDIGYMLATLPENYRLYEHVKKTEKDGKLEVKNKTHAAGGNDRQDAYLYGHPAGRRKRFRSPNDFFPHLLWLCTDESGDPDNCSCKICCPEDLESIMPNVKVKSDVKTEIKSERPLSNTPSTGAPMARQTSQQASKVKSDGPTPVHSLNFSPVPKRTTAMPLPRPKSEDQYLDSLYNSFMYRPGEMLWFQRGAAWGLGVVLRRWIAASNQHTYQVQPLSHPYQHQASVTKSGNNELRPWLAWSLPLFLNEGLNKLPDPPRFETADWQGLMQGRYGKGDLEVDGSILAAKSADGTYTLFGKGRMVQIDSDMKETYYDGIFLGAEKIWVGDVVRLNTSGGQDIVVVHAVVERQALKVASPTVHIVGDMFTLDTVPHSDATVPSLASPSNNPDLPVRLTEDLAFRNARSIAVRKTASYWKLTKSQTIVNLTTIKGRWYEASILLPILHGDDFNVNAQQGDIKEASLFINGRGDCINANRAPNLPKLPREHKRTETRKAAFGAAMPPKAEFQDGVQPPDLSCDRPADGANEAVGIDIDPRFDTAGDLENSATVASGSTALDEFMDLDGAVEDRHPQMPDFGQEYNSSQQASQDASTKSAYF